METTTTNTLVITISVTVGILFLALVGVAIITNKLDKYLPIYSRTSPPKIVLIPLSFIMVALILDIPNPSSMDYYIFHVTFHIVSSMVIFGIWSTVQDRIVIEDRTIAKGRPNPHQKEVVKLLLREKEERLLRTLRLLLLLNIGFMMLLYPSSNNWQQLALRASLLPLIACLLFINYITLEYRIRKGYYGTNSHEAKEIARYILEHTDDLNPPGGGGDRKIFLDPKGTVERDPITGSIKGVRS